LLAAIFSFSTDEETHQLNQKFNFMRIKSYVVASRDLQKNLYGRSFQNVIKKFMGRKIKLRENSL
jgi:hypothetical protein